MSHTTEKLIAAIQENRIYGTEQEDFWNGVHEEHEDTGILTDEQLDELDSVDGPLNGFYQWEDDDE